MHCESTHLYLTCIIYKELIFHGDRYHSKLMFLFVGSGLELSVLRENSSLGSNCFDERKLVERNLNYDFNFQQFVYLPNEVTIMPVRKIVTTTLFIYSLTHSITHPLTHPPTHLPTHSPTHPCTHPLTHPLTHSPARSLAHSLTHSLTG